MAFQSDRAPIKVGIPEETRIMASEQAQGFLEQATQSIQGGMFNQALDLIDQAIALDPENAEAHLLRGVALAQMNQPDAATESFQRAIIIQPNNSKAHFNLAVHQSRMGNKQQALDHARSALDLDPTHAGARELVGQLERELGVGPIPTADGNQPPVQTAAPNPYAQGGGYYREGYASQAGSGHTVAFVERLGPTWTTIGWVLAGLWLLLLAISLLTNGPKMMEAFQQAMANPNGARPMPQDQNIVMTILGYAQWFAALAWMIIDIIDRRSPWWWLVLFVCCCCCAPVQAIYMVTTRKSSS